MTPASADIEPGTARFCLRYEGDFFAMTAAFSGRVSYLADLRAPLHRWLTDHL